uniref:Protein kinase domain-containing protein n=1 Tax=Kalanchoe fedtschenkoi TaxID=63787 RepID=A0A7N0ZTA4_KALFE
MDSFRVLFSVVVMCSHFRFLKSLEEEAKRPGCAPFFCGALGNIGFPFTNSTHPDCGLFIVGDCERPTQKIKFNKATEWYHIYSISQSDSLTIIDQHLNKTVHNHSCTAFSNLSLPSSSFFTLKITPSITLFKCPSGVTLQSDFKYTNCPDFNIYYNRTQDSLPKDVPENCSIIQLPRKFTPAVNTEDVFSLLRDSIYVNVEVSDDCTNCYYQQKGRCEDGVNGAFHCAGAAKGSGITALILMCILTFFIWFYHKAKLQSSNISALDASELQSINYGLPIFSYKELEKATNHFDLNKELGDGGFGTVYHGILQDGREVAVKRLYENTFKRVKIFMNEIEILTRLRHKNLVTLYGCTSHLSRELLLLYEYVPNGTVAYHLYGKHARVNPLSWSTRMTIAIETASALAYLHASDIIHRDVKTANILLDKNYTVKVADFGLSRLFPSDATHITTAPQGTPGYLDPEYHFFYKLTGKSDVYSFGVVLIELISSMPPIDMKRQNNQINLANFAISQIQSGSLSELVDPALGYTSDRAIRGMINCVAELSFRCLQQNSEMRPNMEEVLAVLQGSASEKYETQYAEDVTEEVMTARKHPSLEQLMLKSCSEHHLN